MTARLAAARAARARGGARGRVRGGHAGRAGRAAGAQRGRPQGARRAQAVAAARRLAGPHEGVPGRRRCLHLHATRCQRLSRHLKNLAAPCGACNLDSCPARNEYRPASGGDTECCSHAAHIAWCGAERVTSCRVCDRGAPAMSMDIPHAEQGARCWRRWRGPGRRRCARWRASRGRA